jgi:hypothetical protein
MEQLPYRHQNLIRQAQAYQWSGASDFRVTDQITTAEGFLSSKSKQAATQLVVGVQSSHSRTVWLQEPCPRSHPAP